MLLELIFVLKDFVVFHRWLVGLGNGADLRQASIDWSRY